METFNLFNKLIVYVLSACWCAQYTRRGRQFLKRSGRAQAYIGVVTLESSVRGMLRRAPRELIPA